MVTPDHPQSRIIELDALRGLAVIGIVLMNVYAFALPAQAYYNPAAWGMETQLDRLAWTASFVFVEDKFRTLFAILFGAGCLILIERSGEKPWRAHFARVGVLFLIGIAHSILLASNDILRVYALCGLALPLLAHLSHRALYAIAIGLVAVHVGGGIVAFGGAVVDFYAGRTGTDAALFAERNFGSNEPAIRAALEQGREGLVERVVRRAAEMPQQLRVLLLAVPLNLAGIALGMAMWKDRMLAREWRTFRLQRLAAICAVIAVPALLVLANWTATNGFPGALAGAAGLVLSAPFDTLLGLAYAALGIAFLTSGGAITQALSKVGRMALTNYLLSSLVLAALFASWGVGLFGELSRSTALALGFVPIAAMLIWSPLWLSQFSQGPFERLWRASTRLLS
jgi:uncharacterized protein